MRGARRVQHQGARVADVGQVGGQFERIDKGRTALAPTDVTVTVPSRTSAQVSWVDPADTGGLALDYFYIQASLKALHGDEVIHNRRWDTRVLRQPGKPPEH